ncbi:riboflavin kinase/FMN adenylyltransferase [Haloferula luteola]|uniref:Riboflavin biosynthesis protein n=1 Tax=Haloferula luteola TaxID=595692 RepID=A0A840VF07_9BACT|nr:riboflavin kinase/FMN adenylyltransferase [Haloferula luteola]
MFAHRGVRRFVSIQEVQESGVPVHLALGVFDGVHLGHQAVIGRAIQAARERGGWAGVLTFDPNPLRVLAPEKAPARLLASLDHKAEILAPMGVDFLLALPFDRQRAEVEAKAFVLELVDAGAMTLVSGEDWRFGRDRRGSKEMLVELALAKGFDYHAIPPVMVDGERISSTRIRQAVRDGNMDAVELMLGRRYSVRGTVIHGRQLGRQLGFPTANLEPGEEQYPSDGVWAVWAIVEGNRWPAVANLGVRPTVDGQSRQLEVHLMHFDGDLYGKELEVEWVRHLRGEKRFADVAELAEAIEIDRATAAACLGVAPEA